MKTIVIATVLISSLNVFANNIKMLDIQSDVDGNSKAILSLNTQLDTTIESVTYDNQTGAAKTFSIESLNNGNQDIIKKGPISILSISAKSKTNNDMIFSIHYLYNYSPLGSDRRDKNLRMYFVSPSNFFETVDLDTNKIVTHAFVYVRVVGGKQKGIDRIETW